MVRIASFAHCAPSVLNPQHVIAAPSQPTTTQRHTGNEGSQLPVSAPHQPTTTRNLEQKLQSYHCYSQEKKKTKSLYNSHSSVIPSTGIHPPAVHRTASHLLASLLACQRQRERNWIPANGHALACRKESSNNIEHGRHD